MLDVFVVALVIIQMKDQFFIDVHVAVAVYPFLAAIGPTTTPPELWRALP